MKLLMLYCLLWLLLAVVAILGCDADNLIFLIIAQNLGSPTPNIILKQNRILYIEVSTFCPILYPF
jgi:hypothetical protein